MYQGNGLSTLSLLTIQTMMEPRKKEKLGCFPWNPACFNTDPKIMEQHFIPYVYPLNNHRSFFSRLNWAQKTSTCRSRKLWHYTNCHIPQILLQKSKKKSLQNIKNLAFNHKALAIDIDITHDGQTRACTQHPKVLFQESITVVMHRL